ncbi:MULTISPECIES: type VII secretion protein EccCa [unclassified Microbacterium]|uniref:type VII secretion protein EccCa n=1 Tax=unclassified Microbacterium TaxID=2609290 RepID=UPI00214B4BB7|nr:MULTISPECIES: type VII secretion protein EccCa [unclassified Microbacterium]MCR2784687.1 type VII secretion protein EccCa [Microbacterium sp. zg.B96]WIM16229.1 type VII secretion protein EccCa [Microbacterium sp. zg-B96]
MSKGPRLAPPSLPDGRIVLQPPPELVPSEGGSGILTSLLPMLGSVGAIVMVTLTNAGPTGFLIGGMFLLSSLGFVAVNGWRQRSQRTAQVLGNRREYLAYLADLRETVRVAARKQRRHGGWITPAPAALPFIAEERSRVWEREPGDPAFLLARIGTSDQPLSIALAAPELPPLAQLDPVAASAAHRFMLTHEIQHDVPLGIELDDYARLEIVGPQEESIRSLARAIVTGAATLHDPEDLIVAILAGEQQAAHWEWAKWLPHVMSPRVEDRLGPARMIAASLDDLEDMLPAQLRDRPRFGAGEGVTPHVLLVIDGAEPGTGSPVVASEGMQGVTVIDLPQRWGELTHPATARIALADAAPPRITGSFRRGRAVASTPPARAEFIDLARAAEPFTPDAMSIAEAEATARRLMPLRSRPMRVEDAPVAQGQRELTELLGLPDVRSIDFDRVWSGRLERDRLRVPIGQDTTGAPLVLDIKEAAQQGSGPHGIMVGATGSGKSEVLRTLVLALALTHSPEHLNFVLVDFKGGATFAGMASMPHVSAVITNLGSELALVDRFQDALQGEITRRQELLRAAGNFANVGEYEKARRGGRTDLAPLPALLVIVDEFSELLSAKPEFVESFLNIGRVGRSLHVHLLLASQRLEEGKLRGLDTYLSYRIGLRTFSASESRTIIGTPDAYTLPQEPGVGFLKSDTETLVQFRAAYVSGRPKTDPGDVVDETTSGVDGPAHIEVFTAAAQPVEAAQDVPARVIAPAAAVEERATFQIAVERMQGHGPAAHQVWLPPLSDPASLDELMPDLVEDPQLGLISPGWRAAGILTVPLGLVDVPLEQRRDRLVVGLGGAAGHVAIVGSPLSGKSTLARTLVSALALIGTPQELQFYVLDFGGGSFTAMQQHPHVAGVATRTEPEAVRRTVAEIESIVDAREQYFRRHGIDSIETYRGRRRRGDVDDGFGDVFLVVDGWATVRGEYEPLEARIQTIAARGLSFGVHVIITANRWLEIRASLKDLIQTRLELRQGDPTDSDVDRKQAANVPVGQPGRGLSPAKLQMLGAIPRIDGSSDPATLSDGVQDLIARVSAAWRGAPGPKLRLLPDMLPLDELRALAAPEDRRLLLGIEEAQLSAFGIDPRVEPHLFLYGDSGMGKSAFLRGVVQEITRVYRPDEAKIFVVDYRRALLGEIPADYLGAYLTSHELATGGMNDLAQYFGNRIAGPDVTPEQLRERSWWKGADGFIIVDDYDLVATSQGNPLAVLQPLLAQAGDVGLHVILTRRTGGASRAAYDPIIQRFTDLGVTGILLGGNPEEGALIGRVKPVRAAPGRAQIVSREHGLVSAQLAFPPPTAH